PGYSGIVVAAGRAFTLYQNRVAMYLVALDADRGTELWRVKVDWPWQPDGMYPGPYATPAVADGRVFYATPAGTVGCVAAADGRPLWTVDLRGRFGDAKGTEFGFAATPIVDDGRVLLPVGGDGASLVALSEADGSTLWRNGDDPASYCPVLPITLDGRRLAVGLLQNSLVLHDAATGERLWRERLSSSYDEHAAWPLFDGRRLLVASPFRAGAAVFQLAAADGKATATTVWAGRQLSNDVCSSLRVGDVVYGFDIHQLQASVHRAARGVFKCLDLATGETRWETKAVGQASPLLADGKLLLWTEKGTLVVARANPDRYEELGRFPILGGGGMCWAPPALSNRRLFVRDHERAVCIDLGPATDLDPNRPAVVVAAAGGGFDWTRLVPHEPEFPNDAPEPADLAVWFAACLGVYAGAGVFAGVSALAGRLLGRRPNARIVFAVTAFVLGAAGTTVVGACGGLFALTWPASLYVAFRSLVALGAATAAPNAGWRRGVVARLGLLAFGVLCYGYFHLCMAVGYAMAWGFLGGFFPAAPFAVVAARTNRPWLRWTCDVVGFSVYFATSGFLPNWRAAWSG
ncbi:MAG: PQQ-binding-like beta-propeller repeat protein, partial [Planctomycetia bacterium]